MPISLIAFDADDTLWENEPLYRHAQDVFQQLLSPWQTEEKINAHLFETEMRNLKHYGYGIKAFALSMIETAIDLSDGGIPASDIHQILDLAQKMIAADVRLNPQTWNTLQALSADFPLMLITMGDLLDQSAKIERSGLRGFFSAIEILNEKTAETYSELFGRHQIDPQSFLMVGNSLRVDVAPVLALGGRVAHIPAEAAWAHDHIEAFDPDQPGYHLLEDIGQLPALVAQLARENGSP